MSSSSGQQPVTQTQTSDPWSGAQPYLQQSYGQALGLTNADVGYQPWTGGTVAALNPTLSQGLGAEIGLGNQNLGGTAGVNAALGLGTNLINSGGMTPQATSLAGQYNTFLDQASGQQNPYLQATIDAQNRQIADKVNSSISGAGRYGSGAHTGVLARSLAEASDPILAQDYAQRQQQRLAGMQGLGGVYQNAADLAGKWGQLIPGLDEARYSPAQHVQQGANYFQDRASQDLAGQIQLYNAQQARPWEQLQRLMGIVSGGGALGGTKVTQTTPYQPSTLQRVGGGALAGAGLGSMFGAPGAAVGAGAGGLLGLL